jgi:hypothetical protein
MSKSPRGSRRSPSVACAAAIVLLLTANLAANPQDFAEDPLSPCLRFSGAELRDADLGDGDGVLDPGETVALEIWIENSGAVPVTGVRALLRTDRPDLAGIYGASGLYPDLPVGAAARPIDTPFVVRIDESVPCGTEIPLVLEIASHPTTLRIPVSLPVGGKIEGRIDPAQTLDEGSSPRHDCVARDVPFPVTVEFRPATVRPGEIVAAIVTYENRSRDSVALRGRIHLCLPDGTRKIRSAGVVHELRPGDRTEEVFEIRVPDAVEPERAGRPVHGFAVALDSATGAFGLGHGHFTVAAFQRPN